MLKALLKLLRRNNKSNTILEHPTVLNNVQVLEHKTFTETGEFMKANRFESIWIAKNVNNEYSETDVLNDDDYLDYNLWEDMNVEAMFKKHLPKTRLFRGKNPNIVFHGRCLGCMSQRLHGFERCKGCQYFRGNWNNPNLHIEGEESAKISGDELKNILGSK